MLFRSDEVVAGISARYQELYENIVGEKFVPAAEAEDLLARIERNVTEYLK